MASRRTSGVLCAKFLSFFLVLLMLHRPVLAASDTRYVQTVDDSGNTVYLDDARRPALYTGDYGDCLGDSLINVTRFDAAYYKDNMTVVFHLRGNTNVKNESLMMYIGVFAYGESRFTLTFNPCDANIASLCPMNASVPIEASGIIPVSPSDVAGIPSIALTIPDFEGQALLRIFANSTESEVGCYSAVVTNGATFSHPSAVGTVMGIFTLIAIVASFATAAYGDDIPTMRKHYAHSLSVFVVFAVLHHVFFTGALSVNWPSVLPAWWSNFAWAGGMIYSNHMQNAVEKLTGSNLGSTLSVGAAGAGYTTNDVGGGYSIREIYGRSLSNIYRRATHNETERSWYGDAVREGLPLPGNYSGFAGTLAPENIPASNAFITGFLWFLVLIAVIAAAFASFRWLLEALTAIKLVRKDRLGTYKRHWIEFTVAAVLRAFFIGFFMMMFLTMFQFTYRGSPGVTAIAAILFVIYFVGMFAIAVFAIYYRLRRGNYHAGPDRLNFERKRVWKIIPWYGVSLKNGKETENSHKVFAGSIPWWSVQQVKGESQGTDIHHDEDYIRKFGWLASRFRRTRWWFFAAWLLYEFVRACFYGGAAGHPMVQVFGLLAVETIALIAIITLRPFEATRLNALMVYFLGFSKVLTVALSAAFDIRFNLGRITTTAIGIVIIVIQGILVVLLLISIAVGAFSSSMSLSRNRATFKPKSWTPLREKYFKHINKAADDLPPPPPPPPPPEEPKEPYFNVTSFRRCPKIEDEEDDVIASFPEDPTSLESSQPPKTRPSRSHSLQSQRSFTTVPYGGRVHRASWSSRDFIAWQEGNRHRSSSTRIASPPITMHPLERVRSIDSDEIEKPPAQETKAVVNEKNLADNAT
ncbi:TRP-domain-containing protein [Xylona heveae TC161]|uniref:TRP-domain-containing protein n=1 Tax=Xylona heveae (strain CBS 132557 / TC161) TaxID=1328760 RepID=A0A165FDY9_XYLHT|nr:TRP-domain-containing protein [Xylona heveae TC161]KZF20867.1 TRP-domain-containing protein [Xylona heveae TC161]